MNVKIALNAILGIIVEILYAAAILTAAFLICLILV